MKGIAGKAAAVVAVVGLASAVALAQLTPDELGKFLDLKIRTQELKVKTTMLREGATADTTKTTLTDILGRLDDINGRIEDAINNR